MFKTNEEKAAYALDLWANYIETGNLLISAKDAEKQKKSIKIKELNIDQMKIVISIRELAMDLLGGKKIIRKK